MVRNYFLKGDRLAEDSNLKNLLELADQIFEMPVLILSLIAKERLNYLYLKGINISDISDDCFLTNLIAAKNKFCIYPDNSGDLKFEENKIIIGSRHLLFYCGVPIIGSFGNVIGFFEMGDFEERDFTEKQISLFHKLVYQISEQITQQVKDSLLKTGFTDLTERNRAEALLIQNEERFSFLYNRTPVMLYSLDMESNIVSVSDYWLAKLGYQRVQVIGKNIDQFFTKSSVKDAVVYRFPELNKRGYDFDIPYQIIKRSGEIMDVLVSTIVEKSPQSEALRYLAVVQDITERKRIDEALQQSEDNLRTVFENTNIGYALIDADLFILSFNQEMQKFAQEDLHKTLFIHTFSVLYFSESRQPAIHQAMITVLLGETITYEINYVQTDGSDRWYRMSMFPVFSKESKAAGIVMAIEDINDKKLKELQLTKIIGEISEYKLALDESSIVLITDDRGITTYVNEHCLNISQYERAELLNQDLRYLNSGYHSKEFFKEMWRTIKKGEIWKGEIKNKSKQGNYFWVDCTIVPFLDRDNKPYQFISVQRDITITKNAEFELNRSFDLVNEQNKRLLNFSYIVSHNLRSHISNILSILNFLEKEDSPAERSDFIQHLKRAARSLNDTLYHLNEVLSISNNINLVIESVNLYEYINLAAKVLVEQVNQKKAIINNQVPPNLMINYNPAYLESIVLNFISNAIKYSHPNRQPVIDLSVLNESGKIVLRIADNGIGIDLKRNQEKLFGMYKTFNNNPDARGIGLFITKNQIEAMGGNVTVESELDKGTSFKIYINA